MRKIQNENLLYFSETINTKTENTKANKFYVFDFLCLKLSLTKHKNYIIKYKIQENTFCFVLKLQQTCVFLI